MVQLTKSLFLEIFTDVYMYMYVSHSMSKIKTIYTVTITIEPLSQSLLVPTTHSPSVHVYIQMLTFHPHAK